MKKLLSRINNRKLTFATAMKIRQYKKDNPTKSPGTIVRDLNLPCSDSAVHAILVNRTYTKMRAEHFNPRQALDFQKVKEIRGLLRLGRRTEWIAVKFSVSNSAIQNIKYGITWRTDGNTKNKYKHSNKHEL